MQTQYDVGQRRLSLSFPSRDDVRTFVQNAHEQGAFMAQLQVRPPLEAHTVVLTASEGFEYAFESRVVQVFGGGNQQGAVFELRGWPKSKLLEFQRLLREEAEAANEGEMQGYSPSHRIRQMNPQQRMMLAMKADRTERRLLRMDNSAQVLTGLLGNPRIEAEDVLQIAKNPRADSGLLKRIAEDRRWASKVEIRTALVRNPKTPTPLAIRFLDGLRLEDLRQLSKMGAAKENLRKAALAVYMKRQKMR